MSSILTVSQAAEKLQMTVDVVHEYLCAGKIPGRKIGNTWRVVEADLENWISAGQNEQIKRVSARGFLKQFPGKLSSEEIIAEKCADVEEEERRYEEHGQSGRTRQFVSARGLLKKYPGILSSEEVCAEKLEEAESDSKDIKRDGKRD